MGNPNSTVTLILAMQEAQRQRRGARPKRSAGSASASAGYAETRPHQSQEDIRSEKARACDSFLQTGTIPEAWSVGSKQVELLNHLSVNFVDVLVDKLIENDLPDNALQILGKSKQPDFKDLVKDKIVYRHTMGHVKKGDTAAVLEKALGLTDSGASAGAGAASEGKVKSDSRPVRFDLPDADDEDESDALELSDSDASTKEQLYQFFNIKRGPFKPRPGQGVNAELADALVQVRKSNIEVAASEGDDKTQQQQHTRRP